MALQAATGAGVKAVQPLARSHSRRHPVRVSAPVQQVRSTFARSCKWQRFCVRAALVEEVLPTVPIERSPAAAAEAIGFGGLHHVGLLCANTQQSLDFYIGVLGLQVNEDRVNAKLPYNGAWLWVGEQMIHLMELPNPDPVVGRPAHGGRDRHACFTIKSVEALRKTLDKAGMAYTMSKSGRPALFTRDPDGNALEFQEIRT